MAALWLVVLVGALGLVIYGLGPTFQQRAQHRLLDRYRGAIGRAANEASGLGGVEVPNKAPESGAPVAILEIGRTSLQQAVVEGVGASQTRGGPGHVPGTAGPGQPGNSVLIGRSHAFGKPFQNLTRLRRGDPVLVTTAQGQSVYHVESVRRRTLRPELSSGSANAKTSGSKSTFDDVYGPSDDDRLTLVTSASAAPWNASGAVVAVAKMEGVPYVPTPQGGRTSGQTGLSGETDGRAAALLALALLGAVMAGSVYLYRRVSSPSAYLLTIAPVAAAAIIAAETLSRLLPAWA